MIMVKEHYENFIEWIMFFNKNIIIGLVLIGILYFCSFFLNNTFNFIKKHKTYKENNATFYNKYNLKAPISYKTKVVDISASVIYSFQK